uniref:Uncharacterized protein n=1 Tax=Oryza meridionalis TaxID=40149 RepID=A0A0E0F6I3_9ORYZ
MATMAVIRLALPAIPAAASSSASPGCSVRTRTRGRVVRMRGEEAPESLFAKELMRRGMASGAAAAGAGEKEVGAEEGGRKRVAAAEFERAAAGADGQRARSMALNSEGLEGLVPRAKLLLSLGSTFFLGFAPLILVTVSLFAVLYVYFGPSFVHDASKTPVSPPPYIDPYELLEDERLSRPSPDVF